MGRGQIKGPAASEENQGPGPTNKNICIYQILSLLPLNTAIWPESVCII